MRSGLRLELVTQANVRAAFASSHPNPLFHSYLWRLNISAEHQGRGYGRFAVGELCHQAIRRGQHRLTVSYHRADNGPESFYQNPGFRPAGDYIASGVVAERILGPVALTQPDPHTSPAGHAGS